MADAVVARLGRVASAGPNGVAVVDGAGGVLTAWFLDGVSAELAARGYPVQRDRVRDATDIDPNAPVGLNAVDADEPRSFRRRSKEIFVVGVAELSDSPDDMLK